jgi:hypothetical protein
MQERNQQSKGKRAKVAGPLLLSFALCLLPLAAFLITPCCPRPQFAQGPANNAGYVETTIYLAGYRLEQEAFVQLNAAYGPCAHFRVVEELGSPQSLFSKYSLGTTTGPDLRTDANCVTSQFNLFPLSILSREDVGPTGGRPGPGRAPLGPTMSATIEGDLQCKGPAPDVFYECVATLYDADGRQIWGAEMNGVCGRQQRTATTYNQAFRPPLTLTVFDFASTENAE